MGVFLGDQIALEKNWNNVLVKVVSKLKKWKWLLPSMSYRGRMLVVNNLVSSSLWHRLSCVGPPSNLLSKIQAVLVDFSGTNFTGFLILSYFFLKKRVDRDSYTCQVELVWRPARHPGLGLHETLFKMDFKTVKVQTLPSSKPTVFNV